MIAKITVLCLLVAAAQGLAISVANGGLGLGSGIGLGLSNGIGLSGISNGIGLGGLSNGIGLGLGGNLIGGAGLLGGHGITIAQQPIAIAHQPIAIAHQPVAIAHQPVAIAHQPVAVDLHAPAQYEFKYGVQDAHTGDNKQQSEVRIGDTVKGEYSLAEPDGTIRVVKYTADPHNGFNAVVSRIGKAAHPQVVQKAVALAAPTLISSHGLGLGLGLH